MFGIHWCCSTCLPLKDYAEDFSVPQKIIVTETELQFLRQLKKRRVPFMIVGLSAATLQGAPAVTQDVDLWFRDLSDHRIIAALKAVGGVYVAPTAYTPPMLAGDAVVLFDLVVHMHGLQSFDVEYRRAISVSLGETMIKVLPLDRIIASKQAANRPKDQLVLPMLQNAWLALQSQRNRKRKATTKRSSR